MEKTIIRKVVSGEGFRELYEWAQHELTPRQMRPTLAEGSDSFEITGSVNRPNDPEYADDKRLVEELRRMASEATGAEWLPG